jgi:hypothetical protein
MRMILPAILMMFSKLITRQNSSIFKINKLNIFGFDGESITIKIDTLRSKDTEILHSSSKLAQPGLRQAE